MIGTPTPILRSRSLMCGTAAAASLRSTVTRTSSEPARASAATCATVALTSAVSVLVIDCTTIGAAPPTVTPPTSTATDWRRSLGAASLIAALLCGKPVPERPGPVNVPKMLTAMGADARDLDDRRFRGKARGAGGRAQGGG